LNCERNRHTAAQRPALPNMPYIPPFRIPPHPCLPALPCRHAARGVHCDGSRPQHGSPHQWRRGSPAEHGRADRHCARGAAGRVPNLLFRPQVGRPALCWQG
jgi:hypothetical protein